MATISSHELLERLAKGKSIPGILLLGGETYLRDMCARKIMEAYVPEEIRDWGVLRFSAEDDSISAILGQAQTLPMLAPRQVIFVTDVDAWEGLGDDSREALTAEIAAYLHNPAPFSVLVFEANTLDKRMKLAKMFAEKTLVVAIELSEDPAERTKLATGSALDMAKELGVTLDSDAADELADIFNCELTAIHTELEKLATYVGDRRRITCADVELLSVSAHRYSVWEMTGMLASRQPSSALEFLDSLLREGEAPPAMVGALAWTYRKLLAAQDLPANAAKYEAASRLNMHPDGAELALRQSRKFTRAQLTRGLSALFEADSRLKSGGTSQRAVMEFLVAQLSSS